MKKNLKEIYLNQLKDVIKEIELNDKMSIQEASRFIARVSAVVKRIIGENSEYYKYIEEIKERYNRWNDNHDVKLSSILGVIEGLYTDLEKDYLKSLTELIHDDVFTDFLEMSEHLLSEGFKDAAAVITGSTLEEQLRKLCLKSEIQITVKSKDKINPKKANQLNTELYNNKIIKKGETKQISAWLDIRNNAAHGNYDEYDEKKVELMIEGIRNFILNYPA
ncbi:MAG: hypothetical protein JW891_17685 [Candidatus Lokiarchaeota archaeon]|nr:hypothetical protein [Candidatus Lokiarchaeota archaeon]